MRVGYTLLLDPEREHLAVAKSTIAVAADPDGGRPLVRFDYERGKIGGYPEAHIQISGQSAGLDAVLDRRGRQRPLAKLHFPVGGRRFRPSLDDVIEFLILEGLAEPVVPRGAVRLTRGAVGVRPPAPSPSSRWGRGADERGGRAGPVAIPVLLPTPA
jgi:hypothetical protein